MSTAARNTSLTVGAVCSAVAAVAEAQGLHIDPQVVVAAPVLIGAVGHGVHYAEVLYKKYQDKKSKATSAKLAADAAASAKAKAEFDAAVAQAVVAYETAKNTVAAPAPGKGA